MMVFKRMFKNIFLYLDLSIADILLQYNVYIFLFYLHSLIIMLKYISTFYIRILYMWYVFNIRIFIVHQFCLRLCWSERCLICSLLCSSNAVFTDIFCYCVQYKMISYTGSLGDKFTCPLEVRTKVPVSEPFI